ncbi:hypothetical protein J6590_041365 [Homalodisca vitripennis]|nr:hypothetical protein J6590_041365 [Homalodisca vitripennis]
MDVLWRCAPKDIIPDATAGYSASISDSDETPRKDDNVRRNLFVKMVLMRRGGARRRTSSAEGQGHSADEYWIYRTLGCFCSSSETHWLTLTLLIDSATCDANSADEEHVINYHAAFDALRSDREKAKNLENIAFLTIDLQRTMPLPRLSRLHLRLTKEVDKAQKRMDRRPSIKRQHSGSRRVSMKQRPSGYMVRLLFRSKQEFPLNLSLPISSTQADHIKWLRVDEYGYYHFKTCYDEFTPFRTVNIFHSLKSVPKLEEEVPIRRLQRKTGSIKEAKLENLREQLQFIPKHHRWWYIQISK